ncbi:DMT family transporter [Halotalea alkalilenta]|uniref:Guanidinium exporter n=1 Tax=Halotalea alkalilenta TaxID=376489 RepID=A0A172YDM3_9GAMM|nr:SMR family transporter [Halotalea alkalilenta]ANF57075.1 hypothetical protein A5892_06015 [Halotalea alkalilenta]
MSLKGWAMLLPAAAAEVGWALGLKQAQSVGDWALTLVLVAASFALLLHASRRMPVATAYVVFVALGTAGTAAVDMFWLGSGWDLATAAFIALLLLGVIGLKRTS